MISKCVFQNVLIAALIVGACCLSVSSQAKKKKTTKRASTPPAAVAVKAEEPKAEEPQLELAVKRNSRPADMPLAAPAQTVQNTGPSYTYEFTQPDFVNSRILIEHDEKGKGTIAFLRRGNSEMLTEPLTISDGVLAKLNAAFTELNFLDSTADYQHEKDFSHMGNSRIALRRGDRSRSVTINYTLNKNAKVLMDEYRKISTQAIWIFDVTVARENQPLDGPSQMDVLEGLIRRSEIADPKQLVPFLRELSDDERLPLIARNHANRIIQQIEKSKK